jgi:hypothetical protein
MRRITTVLMTTVAVVSLLVACGTDRADEPIGETRAPQFPSDAAIADVLTATPAEEPTGGGAPAFPVTTAAQTARNAGEWDLVLTGVHVAEHGRFDRIVLEFKGTGIPGWSVNYVDDAVLDGSGNAVALGGDAILDIYASGTTWPAADYYSGPEQFEPENGGDVKDVYVGGTFEGYTQVLAGIDGRRVPFRVFPLSDPARLIVDIVGDTMD